MKPENKATLARVFRAAGYSMKGLKAAYLHEAAFRQEVWMACVLIPIELSGRAKDIGSAAVFMAMVLAGLTWLLVLFFA